MPKAAKFISSGRSTIYQPSLQPKAVLPQLYLVVDSVAWIERLRSAGVRTILLQLRIKVINAMKRCRTDVIAKYRTGVVMTPACLST